MRITQIQNNYNNKSATSNSINFKAEYPGLDWLARKLSRLNVLDTHARKGNIPGGKKFLESLEDMLHEVRAYIASFMKKLPFLH